MMFSNGRVAAFVLGMGMSAAVLADASSAYQEGMEAFRNGQFEIALGRFQEAENEGMQTPTLHYNLATTYYRLNRYAESARHFDLIQDDARWGALAEYNLGLIAEQQDDSVRAFEHYQQAYRKAATTQTLQLSAARMLALSGQAQAEPEPEPSTWSGYISAALGYDDNPSLTGVDEILPSESSDSFFETLGGFSGNLSESVRLNGGFYSRAYDEVNEFNVTGLYAGLFHDRQLGHWRTALGLSLDNYWLDGSQYMTGATFLTQGLRPLPVGNIDIRNQLGYIKGDAAYDYLDGIRNRLTVSWVGGSAEQLWRVGYINEFNDRDDFAVGPLFQSLSPVRHSIFGQLTQQFSARVSAITRLEYRNSRYRDDDVGVDADYRLIKTRRDEDRMEGSMMVRYDMSDTLGTFAEYRYTDNDSNISRYVYDSNQFMLGVDVAF
ncbi:MAG TPA: hypothetical protein ENI17_10385 [Pseudomonas xinjiangensis]|uniref:Tetratricopeptide repeat-containing protein n=2 Tax=root TaxID=1 RepID=A0A7V1BN40_9GAMM|nr:hypothetical protein [Halopseudomonas xinjiangensis]HEC48023.1 hypothetical protein [Halopseudomonas xinjiangensis]